MVSLFGGTAKLPFIGEITSLNRSAGIRFFDLAGLSALAREIDRFNPSIVQTNAGDTVKFAVLSKLLFRWKAPIVLRNANMASDFVTSKPKRFFNKWLVERVDHVVSVSERCKDDFMATYSYPENRITSIPIGIDCDTFETGIPPDLLTFFNGGKVVVNVASLVPEKNHLGLLRIMEKVLKTIPDIKLLVVGDGWLRRELEQNIITMGLQDHVFLLGYRSDVFSLLSNARALLLSSKIEGLPGVILEAQFCKCPVIAYNVGGISEIISHAETGWLIAPGDEAAFVGAITDLFHDGNVNYIKERAYRQALDFDNRTIAKRFARVFEEVEGLR